MVFWLSGILENWDFGKAGFCDRGFWVSGIWGKLDYRGRGFRKKEILGKLDLLKLGFFED